MYYERSKIPYTKSQSINRENIPCCMWVKFIELPSKNFFFLIDSKRRKSKRKKFLTRKISRKVNLFVLQCRYIVK